MIYFLLFFKASKKMANPDTSKSNSGFLYGSTISYAVAVVLVNILLYFYMNSIPYFNFIYWLIFPILIYIGSMCVNMLGQVSSCGTAKPGQALLGGIPTIIGAYVGMALGQIKYFRLPVASAFSSLVTSKPYDLVLDSSEKITNSAEVITKACDAKTNFLCTPQMGLLEAERRAPMLKGISIGYYMFFGILCGQVVSSGLSQSC
jgi:hypothetical protein